MIGKVAPRGESLFAALIELCLAGRVAAGKKAGENVVFECFEPVVFVPEVALQSVELCIVSLAQA